MKRRWVLVVGWLASVAVVGALTWVAASRVVGSDAATDVNVAPATVAVTQGTVERVIPATATLTWPTVTVVQAVSGGVVTREARSGSARQGDVLAWVDELPVVIARGDVPAYRELREGLTGADVAQLQQLLIDTGTVSETFAADGVFGQATARGVTAWEKALGGGGAADGVVSLGEVVFVSSLPAAFAPGDGMRPGAVVAPGDPLGTVRAAEPTLVVLTEGNAAAEFREGIGVTLTTADGPVQAALGAPSATPEGQTRIPLTFEDGCGAPCEAIEDGAQLPLEVEVVPTTSGPTVPVAAIRQGADGATMVVTPDGVHHPVTVLASDRGVAVVEGVEVGLEVLLVEPS